MFKVDESNPLKSVREVSYFLYALVENLPEDVLNKLTSQRFNMKHRKALKWKLHLLNHACDRAERGAAVTDEDVQQNRALPKGGKNLSVKRNQRGPF